MGSSFNLFAFAGITSILIMIVGFVIWIMGLIDCLKRDFEKSTDKIIWILVILFLNAPGSIIYYFVVVKPTKKAAAHGLQQPD